MYCEAGGLVIQVARFDSAIDGSDWMMMDLVYGIGLVLMIEGIAYALVPDSMKRMLITVLAESSDRLRWSGVGAAALGLVLIWLTK